MHIVGDVAGRDVLVVDDMVDTAGTLSKRRQRCGALGHDGICWRDSCSAVWAKRCNDWPLPTSEQLVVTDTIPLSAKAQAWERIQVLSVAPLLGEAIKRIHCDESVSSLFD